MNRTTTAVLLVALMVSACDRQTPTPEASAEAPAATDTSQATTPPVIGHDSAFGPIGTVADTGTKVDTIRRP